MQTVYFIYFIIQAEFILIGISPLYITQADPLMENVSVNGNGLHTALIYRLMQVSYYYIWGITLFQVKVWLFIKYSSMFETALFP